MNVNKNQNLTMTEALQKTESTLLATKHKWMHMLPKHVEPDKAMHIIMNVVRNNIELLNSDHSSFWGAIYQVLNLGLRPDGIMGEAYMVPIGGQVKLFIGYKGLIALARRSGEIAKVTASVAREGDAFSYQMGDNESIEHAPATGMDRASSPITQAYVIVTLNNGEKVRAVMDRSELEEHKHKHARGANRKDSPWNTSFEQMALKTVIKKLFNSGSIPMSTDLSDALSDDGHIPNASMGTLQHEFITSLSAEEAEQPAEVVEAEA